MDSPHRPDRADPHVAALLDRTTLPAAGTPVTAAVSGGADSTALLALCVAAGLEVTAVHVDHGLRAGSAVDADRVVAMAAAWGARARRASVTVEPGPNLEERARDARRSVLPPDALFGHTADDQAETLLVRLLRGTGPGGLAQMAPATHPLLALRRRETRALCAHLGLDPVEDPMNADPRFVRNRVRADVLPLLDDVAGRDVVPLLCRLAHRSAAQRDLLDCLVDPLDPTDARALAAAPASSPRSRCDGGGRSGAATATARTPPRRTGCSRWSTATHGAPRSPMAGAWSAAGVDSTWCR